MADWLAIDIAPIALWLLVALPGRPAGRPYTGSLEHLWINPYRVTVQICPLNRLQADCGAEPGRVELPHILN